VVPPVSDALTRVTKKPFGIYVRPGASPVSPERFQGYHTGVDFETTVAEQASDVTISAICAGPLVLKKWASGYGGVAVQSCRLGAQDVTVIYGHLRLSSISATVGQELKPGQALGVLGKGYSTETDGERKHLHLGIHQGSAIDIRGYVQNQADLGQWLDVRNYLGQ
jgi:murein DD-endopeptidase MepM/ murein hydrolase activator NlpD